MMPDQQVVAVIPARGGSKGIPRKNLQDIGGKPLLAHSIDHARRAETVDAVVVTSDDEEIRSVARSFGAQVLARPPEHAWDTSPADPMLIATVQQWEEEGHRAGIVVLLYPTAPLRDPASIDRAVRMIREEGYDSVLSLYPDHRYLWKRDGDIVAPINYDPTHRMPRQMENWNQWAENKAVYAVTRELLLSTGCRLGGRIGFVEMDRWRSIDVDSPEDLLLARLLYERMIPEPRG